MASSDSKRQQQGLQNHAALLSSRTITNAPWWHQLLSATMHSPMLDQRRNVYTNRNLRFDRVEAVGFDFDHTLAVYNCENLDRLATELVTARLIADGVPKEYMVDFHEANFARQGLLVDTHLGQIIKIDRYGHVTHAYFGKSELSPEEKRDAYSDMDVIPHVTQGDRFIQIDSAFAKPEVLIYATLAPKFEESKRAELWDSIRSHTDGVHKDGSLKAVITANPLDFLFPDPEVVPMLQQLKAEGKKVFLVTNSEWEYTKVMMNPALGLGEDPEDMGWLDLFDLAVVFAKKPGYFSVKNNNPAKIIGPDKLLEGGSILDIEQRLHCSGPEILYVGDHIYSDLITSKRRQHWRTMMVVPELEEELQEQAVLPGIVAQLKQVDDRRVESERVAQHWKSIVVAIDRLQDSESRELVSLMKLECEHRSQAAKEVLQLFIDQREELRAKLSSATNPYWGSLFRASNELTYYGRQLEDFACIYSSRASNLLYYSADHYFRSAMDYLPHELEQL